MTPVILLDADRRFVGAIGSAGGNAILAYVAKALVGAVDWGLPMQDSDRPAQPRRARRQFQRRGDQVLAGGAGRACAQRGIELRPGQGEDSGVHGVMIRDGRDRRRRRSAARGRACRSAR